MAEESNSLFFSVEEELSALFLESDFVLFKWQNHSEWPVEAVSENVKKVFGYDAVDFTEGSLSYAELIHSDDLERVEAEVKQGACSKNREFTHEPYRIRRSDNTYIWVYDSTRVLCDEEGAITHYVGYIVDITDLKEKEAEVQFLKERYELATLAVNDGLWDWNILSGETWISDRLKSMVGYAENDIWFNDWTETLHPEDLPRVLADVERHLKGETGFFENIHRVRYKNGEWLWVLDRGKALFDASGKPYRMLGFNTDITEKRKAEESLNLYAKIYENSQEGITITDAQSRIISVNSAFTKITGYSRDEVIGKTPAILSSGRHDKAFYESLWDTLLKEGSWQGEIYNRKKSGEIYPEWISIFNIKDTEDEVVQYAAIFSDIIPLKEALKKSDYLSNYDSLTNLPNRYLLHDRADQALLNAERNGSKVALLYLDLDHFKNINDSLGHHIGDKFLTIVASKLKSAIRKNDTLSRQGGDEFLILLSDISSEYDIINIAEKIQERMAEVITIDHHAITSSFSIGITVAPEDGTDFDTLFKHADTAMYQAKQSGRNTFRFFEPLMNDVAKKKHHMHMALSQALEKNELTLHYQPQFDIGSQRIFGAEALVRWSSSEFGNVPPAEFIPIAEETGLIIPIGEWIFQEACAQAKAWSLDADMPELSIAVNISAMQFKQADFKECVLNMLAKHSLDTKYLELELTESLLIQDMEQNQEILNALKARGIKFSIDDFGTGYSSLNYLKEIPASRLKIDRTFIENLRENSDDEAIVRSVISLGKHFGMQVIAEGVETKEHLDFLTAMNCHEIQGYYISRPVSAAAFEAFIKTSD